jgi:hypothetical protein
VDGRLSGLQGIGNSLMNVWFCRGIQHLLLYIARQLLRVGLLQCA